MAKPTTIPIKTRTLMIKTYMNAYLEGKVKYRSRQDIVLLLAIVADDTEGNKISFDKLKEVAGIIYDQMSSGVCLSLDYTASV